MVLKLFFLPPERLTSGPLTCEMETLCHFRVRVKTTARLHKDATWKHHSEPTDGPSKAPKFRWPVVHLSPQFQSESDDLFIFAGAEMPFEHYH